MRRLVTFFLAGAFIFGALTSVEAQQKMTKAENRQQQFEETKNLVESRNFIFEADRAFPSGGASIDLTTNYGYLKVKEDSIVVGDLPFFGRAFSVDYGGGGGIEFSGKMDEQESEIDEEKKTITYSFKVKDGDYFQVSLQVSYNGDASLNVISHNRSAIRYQGDISRVEEN
ncbi:DUF4251 domain-containing protein [Marinilabilia salmonicolor]|uniref:DUF4251 domain-containing protein n=1 Tax=Marinilabilia salmonicolor TaxID=989 RepID=UPI00029A9841|nr:DUF4251 domain-containing protein [Marinilabilia salmonicolor]